MVVPFGAMPGDQGNQGNPGNQQPPDNVAAGNQGTPPPPTGDFERILNAFRASGGAKRGQAKLVIKPTGAARSNSEGKEVSQGFVKGQGGDPLNINFTFGASAAGQFAIYAAKVSDPGAMQVVIHKNALNFHVGAIFETFPALRPNTTVDCSFAPGVDKDGVPCLIVNIAGGAPSRIVKRKKKGSAKPEENKDK